ncbi:MAG TPA: hypothetical protein VMS99_10665 [Acidimicrobiia bacterium]|nr:hypothetical protein [Acidimicrobiia bacterium]
MRSGLVSIGLVLAVLLLLHLLASWAERKGWIIYRSDGSKGRGVALSNALAEFEAVLNPAAEHRIEEERSQRVIATETGLELLGLEEDPNPGLDHG